MVSRDAHLKLDQTAICLLDLPLNEGKLIMFSYRPLLVTSKNCNHRDGTFCLPAHVCEHSQMLLSLQAEQKLQSQRRHWLRSESLHRGLQEMIQDHCIRKHHATVPPDQNMVQFTYSQSTNAPTAVSKSWTTYCMYFWSIKLHQAAYFALCIGHSLQHLNFSIQKSTM